MIDATKPMTLEAVETIAARISYLRDLIQRMRGIQSLIGNTNRPINITTKFGGDMNYIDLIHSASPGEYEAIVQSLFNIQYRVIKEVLTKLRNDSGIDLFVDTGKQLKLDFTKGDR